MRSRIALATATAVMATALAAGSVFAANSKSTFRNCANDFYLDSSSNWYAGTRFDWNNDGSVCVRYSPLPGQANAGDYIVVDNTAP